MSQCAESIDYKSRTSSCRDEMSSPFFDLRRHFFDGSAITRFTRGARPALASFISQGSVLVQSRKRKSQLWVFVSDESTCTLRDLVQPGSETHPMIISSCRWF